MKKLFRLPVSASRGVIVSALLPLILRQTQGNMLEVSR